jgi:hypothetical protein
MRAPWSFPRAGRKRRSPVASWATRSEVSVARRGGGTSRPRRARWTGSHYGDRCRAPNPAGNAGPHGRSCARAREPWRPTALHAVRGSSGAYRVQCPPAVRGPATCGGALRAGLVVGLSCGCRDRGVGARAPEARVGAAGDSASGAAPGERETGREFLSFDTSFSFTPVRSRKRRESVTRLGPGAAANRGTAPLGRTRERASLRQAPGVSRGTPLRGSLGR